MRVSCDPSDPGYNPQFSMCRIFLDGHERDNIQTADEGKRVAITFDRDEWGRPVIDKKTGAQKTDRFTGSVRIDCPDWLRRASEEPQEEADTLSAAIWAQVP